MNVVVRTDSSAQIGSGHLMRCLTLAARMKKQQAEVHFICRDLVGNLSGLVEKQGYILHLLPQHELVGALSGYATWLTVTQETDAEETQEVLRGLGEVSRMVVDHYALDSSWESAMRPLAKEIFVIDDLANRRHDCDFLLDQNFYLGMKHRYDGLVPEHCKLLLGPSHALLREEFYEARKTIGIRKPILRHILVFYGGADLTDETTKALHALLFMREVLADVTVDVIVGAGNPHRENVRALCESPEAQGWVDYHCQVGNMAEMMAHADLMLGAGGSTTWERCFLGLPAIVTAVAENQLQVCEDCAKVGLIHYLGRWDEVTEQDICQALRVLMIPDKLAALQKSCRLECDEEMEVRPL